MKRLAGGNLFVKSRISYWEDNPLKSQATGREPEEFFMFSR
jgi:hypothetical protein